VDLAQVLAKGLNAIVHFVGSAPRAAVLLELLTHFGQLTPLARHLLALARDLRPLLGQAKQFGPQGFRRRFIRGGAGCHLLLRFLAEPAQRLLRLFELMLQFGDLLLSLR
jgi:hypothetical protein